MTDREQEQLLASATDRFERRLAEESASLREEIADLRTAMVEGDGALRQEIAALRTDMVEQRSDTQRDIGSLRLHMTEQFAATERRHYELLKWVFVFWVGQAAVVITIITALT